MEVENIEFDLVPVVEGSLEIVAGKARDKGLALMSYVDPDIPHTVVGDPGRLRQILLNMTSNAVKFTPNGEVIMRALSLGEADGCHRVRFEVKDSGIGMSPEVSAKLFIPFTQADGSVTRKYGGTGLGLSICRRLAELMHGVIGVDSKEGQGSTFWLELPMPVGVNRVPPRTARDFSGTRILVVTASQTQQNILSQYLERWNISAIGANSGEEAMQKVRNEAAFDIAIICARLPDMPGSTLAETLAEANDGIKLILLADTENARRTTSGQAFNSVLLQPVKQSSLLDALMLALDRRQRDIPVEDDRRATAPVIDTAQALKNNTLILLVEDNHVNQRVAINLLSKLGYAAHVANNGQEAVDILDRLPYGLVLMDCQMPVMDGFEATRSIRRAEQNSSRHIPIIAMTANAMQGDRESCLEAGMDEYLSKPIDQDALLAALRRWIPAAGDDLATPAQQPPPTASGTGVIDMVRLRDLFGDDTDIVCELLEVFMKTTSPLLDKLKFAIVHSDFSAIKSIGHQIAGSAANLGVTRLHELGRAAEKAAADLEIGQAEEVHASMLEAFRQVADFIKNELK
jgi:CheY-like chemotaxis protein/HPt (histidine-containing phosphotransfer) domain-containing protein